MKSPPERFAYSYLRMSTESQLKGDSRRRQLELSDRYAKTHGLTLVKSLEDIGISAFHGEHTKSGAFGELLALLEDGVIPSGSFLLIESLDRISRENILPAFTQLVSLLNHGLTVVTLADGQEYTKETFQGDAGQIYTSLGIMFRANEESKTKSRRLSSAWENKRAMLGQKKLTSMAPAWLTLNKLTNTFDIVEPAAQTVREIFDLSIEGTGAYGIARKLNLERRSTLGTSTLWHRSYISKILNNQSVFGLFQPMKMHNGKRVPEGHAIEDYFPPVITKERFMLSQAKMRERSEKGGGRQGGQFTNIFTKLAKCSACGSTLTLINKGSGAKGGRYLHCSNSNLKGTCNATPWSYFDFERDFFTYIKEVDLASIIGEGNNANVRAQLENEKAINSEQKRELRIKADTLLERLENPTLVPPVIAEIEKLLANRLEEIEILESRSLKIDQQLMDLTVQSVSSSQEAANLYFSDVISEKNPAELEKLRRKIHFGLRNSIETIEVDSRPVFGAYIFEIESVEPRVLSLLKQAGYSSLDDINTYYDTVKGAKFLAETSRSFKVVFKNCAVRQVRPGLSQNVKLRSDKFAALLRRRKEKANL